MERGVMETLTDAHCEVHTMGFDGDCDYCNAEVTELQKLYDSQVKQNQQQSALLASQGARLDPFAVIDARLTMILDLLFQSDPKARGRFELLFVRKVHAALLEVEQQHARQRLTQGVRGLRPDGRIG